MGGGDVCDFFGLPTGCDANSSLTASMMADGSVTGQYHDQSSGGVGLHANIDCLNVVGTSAVVSGVITSGFAVGQDVVTAVIDNGKSKNDPADQVSLSFIGFGFTCTQLNIFNLPLFNLANGQVTVR